MASSSIRRISLMFLLVALIVAIATVRVSNAAAWAELLQPDPAHPGICIKASKNIRLAVGESGVIEGECSSVTCRRSEGAELVLAYVGCGVMQVPEGCRSIEDVRRPHPDCCPRLVCPD